jgi:hypothetical protein
MNREAAWVAGVLHAFNEPTACYKARHRQVLKTRPTALKIHGAFHAVDNVFHACLLLDVKFHIVVAVCTQQAILYPWCSLLSIVVTTGFSQKILVQFQRMVRYTLQLSRRVIRPKQQ